MRLAPIFAVGLVAVTAAGHRAHAASCPVGSPKVKVIVNNPTTSTGQQVTLSGNLIGTEITCQYQHNSYSQVVNLYTTGDNEFILPASGALNTGMWVHHISTNVGGNQHQQTPVLLAPDPSEYTTVRWTYHPTVITVNVAGDAGGGSCTTSCTFRQALNRANSLVNGTPAILIQFSVSPGAMTQSGDLVIGSAAPSPIITIDGTDSNGNPWIVGDALAAAQGNQDPIPRVVDLKNTTKITVAGDNVTIKGLALTNTVASGSPTKTLVESARANTRLERVRLDGGATGACTGCGTSEVDLVRFTGGASHVVNVEGRASFGDGADVQIGGAGLHQVRDSWFHHNYRSNVAVDGALLSRNMIELAGRRITDNTVVYGNANGVRGVGPSEIDTQRNFIRNNTAYGINATLTNFGLDFAHDYACGNQFSGISFGGVGSGTATGSGLTTAYNDSGGLVVFGSVLSGTLNFNNHSAFTANYFCGLSNGSSVTMSAINNQWRGATTTCTQSPDRCPGGPINCDPIQGYRDVPIQVDTGQPTFPSNVFLTGQTVRVQGRGFNAIDGNPESTETGGPATCTIGSYDVSNQNCCRKKDIANVCVPQPGAPAAPADHSNCVAVRDFKGTWSSLAVSGVTPTTITAEVPQFASNNVGIQCVGGYTAGGQPTEIVRVVKRNSVGDPIQGQGAYCRNWHQL